MCTKRDIVDLLDTLIEAMRPPHMSDAEWIAHVELLSSPLLAVKSPTDMRLMGWNVAFMDARFVPLIMGRGAWA